MTEEVPAGEAPWYQRRWVQLVAGGLILFIIGAAVGASGKSSSKTTAAPAPAVTQTAPGATETVTVAQTTLPPVTVQVTTTYTPPPITSFGNGTYLVGSDVQPGTYKSPGPDGSNSAGCYWELADASDNTIRNDISQGQSVVTVPSSAHTLKIEGCQGFVKA